MGPGQTSNIVLLSFDRQNTEWVFFDSTLTTFESSLNTPDTTDVNQQFFITTDPNTGEASLNWMGGVLLNLLVVTTDTSAYKVLNGSPDSQSSNPILLQSEPNCPGMWQTNDFNTSVPSSVAYLSSGLLIGDSELTENQLYWVALPDSSSCSDVIPEIYVFDTGVPINSST